ncbi:hypothetical protein DFJ74DRAFT_120903 [Hyaloraphidium curvatum]|nr:hypothetical protein DFJ74DRAFT_120903 [Hyaloraphidium curvatum]
MPIIDAQVHCYERDHPGRPWHAFLHGPPEVNGDDQVRAMDAVGVDGAILVSPFAMYKYDAEYALQVWSKHPGRFGLVKPVDPTDPTVGETVRAWKDTPGAVGIRIMLRDPLPTDPADPGLNRVLAAAAEHDLPVNVLCWGRLRQMDGLAARNPRTRIVIDHLGLTQHFEPPPPEDPWGNLPDLLALAKYPNVFVKITGACTLSREPYPYDDIWDPLWKIFHAFGFERCMWGTDWTRAVEFLNYKQGVEPFRTTDRLSESERAMLMGGTAERVYRWSPKK